jgi:hypothetical protein
MSAEVLTTASLPPPARGPSWLPRPGTYTAAQDRCIVELTARLGPLVTLRRRLTVHEAELTVHEPGLGVAASSADDCGLRLRASSAVVARVLSFAGTGVVAGPETGTGTPGGRGTSKARGERSRWLGVRGVLAVGEAGGSWRARGGVGVSRERVTSGGSVTSGVGTPSDGDASSGSALPPDPSGPSVPSSSSVPSGPSVPLDPHDPFDAPKWAEPGVPSVPATLTLRIVECADDRLLVLGTAQVPHRPLRRTAGRILSRVRPADRLRLLIAAEFTCPA